MSRVNFGAKPLMYPQPVLIIGTYDENGVPNAMNAAWGITIKSSPFHTMRRSLSELRERIADASSLKWKFATSDISNSDERLPTLT